MQIINTRLLRGSATDEAISSQPYVTFCGKRNAREQASFPVHVGGYITLTTSTYSFLTQSAISIPIRGKAIRNRAGYLYYDFRLWMNNETGKMEFSLDGSQSEDTSRVDWCVIASWPIAWIDGDVDTTTVKLPLAIQTYDYQDVAPKHLEVVVQWSSDLLATSCIIKPSSSEMNFLIYMSDSLPDPGTDRMYLNGNYNIFTSTAQSSYSVAAVDEPVSTGVTEDQVRGIATQVVESVVSGKYTAI